MLQSGAALSTTYPVILISSGKHNHNDPFPSSAALSVTRTTLISASIEASSSSSISKLRYKQNRSPCRARRRVRYEAEQDDDEEEYGHNEEIALLEMYSQSARDEALLVRALVDDKEEEILIFKGFSSSLTYGTSPDLSKSVLPARAVIKFVDRVRGPFNPANIEYIERGVSWESFKARLFSLNKHLQERLLSLLSREGVLIKFSMNGKLKIRNWIKPTRKFDKALQNFSQVLDICHSIDRLAMPFLERDLTDHEQDRFQPVYKTSDILTDMEETGTEY